jgi:hypothetical protein
MGFSYRPGGFKGIELGVAQALLDDASMTMGAVDEREQGNVFIRRDESS